MQQLLSRHRWIVLAIISLGCVVTFFPSGWGVFQPYLVSELGFSENAASLVLSLATVCFGICSIPGGRFQDKHGPKKAGLIGTTLIGIAFFNFLWLPAGNAVLLHVGYSLFFGAGCGFLYQSMMVTLMKWYADRTGFAAGFTSSMAGFFLMAQTYLTDALLARLGVRMSMVVCGVIAVAIGLSVSCVLCTPSAAYMDEKLSALRPVAGPASAGSRYDFTPAEMLRTRQFYLFFAAVMFLTPAYNLLAPQFVSLGMAKGLNKAQALSAFSLGSGAGAVSKLIIPALSDKLGRKPTMTVLWGCTAVFALLFYLASGSPVMVIWVCMCLFYSGGSTLINPFNTDLFGLANAGANFGIMNISSSAGSLLGPVVQGLLTPILGNSATCLVSCVSAFLGFGAMAGIQPDMSGYKEKA